MSWELSRFRAGDLVEVLSKEEILATLDEKGCLDGMPFMPEMLQYCGQRVRVDFVAHKTCETAKRTWQGRTLNTSVHLVGLRCDGAAHGGCQADCKLFWKDEWLKPAESGARGSSARVLPVMQPRSTESTLRACTQRSNGSDGEIRYACQATELFDATAPLKWWEPRQYVLDITTGNHSVGAVARVIWLAMMRSWLRHTPRGYRIVRAIRNTTHRWLMGRDIPDVDGKIPAGQPTPTLRLDLVPGERVRIKPKHEILATLGPDNRNRGLSFDQEMVRFCGSVATVRRSVTQIIEEGTGKMMRMKNPCIILDQVVCTGQYSACRLLCPRELPAFWRELWLERVDASAPHAELPPTVESTAKSVPA